MTTVTTPIAARTPSPLRTAQLARDRGVDSTTSSRRRPSSLAQPARNDAPARPEDERAEAEERQLEQRRRLGQVEARIDRLDQRGDLRQRRDHLAERVGRRDDQHPVQRRCRGPTRSRCRPDRPAAALNGPRDARRQRRQPQPADVRDTAEVAPLEGDDADGEEDDDRPRPAAATDGQSVTPAIGRWPAVQTKNDSGFSASMIGDRLA